MEKACSTCGYRININMAAERGLISIHDRDMNMQACCTDYCYSYGEIVSRRRSCPDWISYEVANYETNPPY